MRLVPTLVVAAALSALTGPARANPDIAALVGAVADSCPHVDEAQYEGTGGDHLHACRDAMDALFLAAMLVGPGEQEQLGLAFAQVAQYEPPVSPEVDSPRRQVWPTMESDLTSAVLTACTEGFRGSAPVLDECLAVTRTALVGAQVFFKGEMGDVATTFCQVPTFAPPGFHDPFFGLIDEIVARSASGSDPMIGGDFTPLAEARAKWDNCR